MKQHILMRQCLQFPKELEEAAVRKIHHSSLPLEELVTEIQLLQSSPGNSGKENLPGQANGREPENSKAAANGAGPVASESIRCWLLKVDLANTTTVPIIM